VPAGTGKHRDDVAQPEGARDEEQLQGETEDDAELPAEIEVPRGGCQ